MGSSYGYVLAVRLCVLAASIPLEEQTCRRCQLRCLVDVMIPWLPEAVQAVVFALLFGRQCLHDPVLQKKVYKRKKIIPSESLKFEELSDVDISHAVPRRLHNLAFTGSKWVAFADPVQQTGWLIDLKIASLYVGTGKKHRLRKVVNSGTRLCSFIPETRNIVVSTDQSYVLKTGIGKRGSLKMVSEIPQRESSVWGNLC